MTLQFKKRVLEIFRDFRLRRIF